MRRRTPLFLLAVIYLGFVSLGLPDGTLGIAWPRIHDELALPVELAGTLMLVGTLFSAVSSFSSGIVIRRFGTGPVVLVSCAMTGTGLMIISGSQSIWWLWLAAVPLGFGAGAVDTGLNGYVARHYSGRHMNWLHACWGVGATCGPLLITRALAGSGGWRGGFFLLASIQLTFAIVFLVTLGLWTRVPERGTPAPRFAKDGSTISPQTPANSEAGWLSSGIFVLYVAAEGCAGIWAGSIMIISRGIPESLAGASVAGYFGSITVGRVLVGFIVDRWGNRRLVALGLALAIAGAGVFIFSRSGLVAALALSLLGLGLAPVYPCMMHEVPHRFAASAAMTVISRQSGAAYLGGALLPAAAGWLARQSSLESIPWAIAAGLLVLAAAVRRLNRIT